MSKCILGKKHNIEICQKLKVGSWKVEQFINSEDKYELQMYLLLKKTLKMYKKRNILATLFLMTNTIKIKEKTDRQSIIQYFIKTIWKLHISSSSDHEISHASRIHA